ncbi:MAG: hypothetical protein Q8873_08885 [Bacillota bacterium]|nr:hypothetical protein [Bacillota bacterium]
MKLAKNIIKVFVICSCITVWICLGLIVTHKDTDISGIKQEIRVVKVEQKKDRNKLQTEIRRQVDEEYSKKLSFWNNFFIRKACE